MNPIRLRVPAKVKDGLLAAQELSDEQKNTILEYLESCERRQLPELSAIAETVAPLIEISDAKSIEMFESLASLNRAILELKMPVRELFRAALEPPRSGELDLDFIEAVLSSWLFRTITKIQLLRTDFDTVYLDSKIITDVRHVFSDSPMVESPEASAVIHSLKIRFEQNRVKHFYVAMDSDDLKDLRNQIDRALEKEKSLRRLSESMNLPCYGLK